MTGERDGAPVELDIVGIGGLTLDGPGAPDVARCLVVALLAKGGPHVVQVLVPTATAARLLPGIAPFPGLNLADDDEAALREAEVQLVRRARLLDEEGVADFASHRSTFPDDPLPAVILVADDLAGSRMAAVASLGPGSASVWSVSGRSSEEPAGSTPRWRRRATSSSVSPAPRAATSQEPLSTG